MKPIASCSALVIASVVFGVATAGAIPVVNDVEIELYHVFPVDSDPTRTPNVVTRVNSPSDNNFLAAAGALGQLTFTTTVLNPNFTVANSVFNNINPAPNQFTGGQGSMTDAEVQFDVKFTPSFPLTPGDHIFFRPEVDFGSAADFLWLSASHRNSAHGAAFLGAQFGKPAEHRASASPSFGSKADHLRSAIFLSDDNFMTTEPRNSKPSQRDVT